MPQSQSQPPALGNGGNDQIHLQPRELFANALAAAAAEGEVGEVRPGGTGGARHSLWIESPGIGEEAGVVMDAVG